MLLLLQDGRTYATLAAFCNEMVVFQEAGVYLEGTYEQISMVSYHELLWVPAAAIRKMACGSAAGLSDGRLGHFLHTLCGQQFVQQQEGGGGGGGGLRLYSAELQV